jgi:hypothetical protein
MKGYDRIRLYWLKKTDHFYAEVPIEGELVLLDLGTDPDSLLKFVEMCKKEFGGFLVPPGGLN